jgi:curli biogenesis system outer membrane secretion channel CsgG
LWKRETPKQGSVMEKYSKPIMIIALLVCISGCSSTTSNGLISDSNTKVIASNTAFKNNHAPISASEYSNDMIMYFQNY